MYLAVSLWFILLCALPLYLLSDLFLNENLSINLQKRFLSFQTKIKMADNKALPA